MGKLRDRRILKKNQREAERMARESLIRKAYGHDVSDEYFGVNIAPASDPVKSTWKVVLSILTVIFDIALGALALIGLISLVMPETRALLLDQWNYTIANFTKLLGS